MSLLRVGAACALLAWGAGLSAAERPYTPDELALARQFVAANPEFGAQFTRAWEAVLGRLESLREHRAFLAKRGQVGLVITDAGRNIKDRTAARYVLGEVFLNRTYLALQAAQLGEAGLDGRRAAEVLAWKMMPVLAHEIRHGIVEERMRARLGIECGAGLLEDEELAFYDNALVTGEAVSQRADLWDDALLLDIDAQNGTILSRWRQGREALAELVRQAYPDKKSILKLDRAGFLRELEKDGRNLEEILRESPRHRRVLAESRDAASRERSEAYLRSPPSEEEARALLAKNKACRAAMALPEKFSELQGFYRGRLRSASGRGG